jgi:Flp pilus assembly protein TadG
MRTKVSKGQSLVEFALILIVLMLIFMGVFDLGFAVYAYNTISLAAREGARKGIVCTNSVSTIQAQAQAAAVGLNLTSAQVDVQPNQPNPDPKVRPTPCSGGISSHSSLVIVTVSYTYTPFTLLIAQALGTNSLTLSSRSTMVVE